MLNTGDGFESFDAVQTCQYDVQDGHLASVSDAGFAHSLDLEQVPTNCLNNDFRRHGNDYSYKYQVDNGDVESVGLTRDSNQLTAQVLRCSACPNSILCCGKQQTLGEYSYVLPYELNEYLGGERSGFKHQPWITPQTDFRDKDSKLS